MGKVAQKGPTQHKYKCCVERCNADERKDVSKYEWMKNVTFHSFPHARYKKKERAKWIDLIRRKGFVPNRESRVCSLHFVGGCGPTEKNPEPTLFPYNNYKLPVKFRSPNAMIKRSKKQRNEYEMDVDSAPGEVSIVMGPFSFESELPKEEQYQYVAGEICVSEESHDAKNCALPTAMAFYSTEAPSADHQYCSTLYRTEFQDTVPEKQSLEPPGVAVQTTLTMEELDDILTANTETTSLKARLDNKAVLMKGLVLELLLKDDVRVKRYTGIPTKAALEGLFNLLKGGASKLKYWTGSESVKERKYQAHPKRKKPGPSRKLGLFDEFVLTLLRLRLGLTNSFLGDLFGVSDTTASSIFITWITFMHLTLKPLLTFPSRQLINATMPPSFKTQYPKTRVIIDCTEIFIEKPRTSPTAQAVTYSQYKSHNTYKVLVGITPNGAFSFVSNLWGGNVSDRHLTINSGLLDLLQPGDDVMADRGFTIRDALTRIHCTLNMPPFTRKCTWGKKKRLNASEIKQTACIAKLRIHVERAIERLRHFKLLNHVMPLTLKPIAQQIITVSAVLCNFLPPLVDK